MKQKKIPMRKCVITGEQKPKKELIRIVRGTDGEVSVDTTGKNLIDTHLCTKAANTNIPKIEAPFVTSCNNPPERSSVILEPAL